MKNRLCLLLAAAALLLAGCGHTRPARFHSLRDPIGAPSTVAVRADAATIALEEVALADYLHQPQLVRQVGPHEVQYLEFDRWAGALRDEMTDVLMEALGAELGAAYQVRRREGPADAGRTLCVEVLQLELEAEGTAVLKARWRFAGGPAHTVVTRADGDVGAAHRTNLGTLVVQMAAGLRVGAPPAPGPADVRILVPPPTPR